MALRFTGNETTTTEFEMLLEAFDGESRVVVITSKEAIEDFGRSAVEAKASDKYSRDLKDQHGRVRVFTTDF